MEKKAVVLTDQTEKLKRFIASRGLGEAFAEFVRSLAPKTMKQRLEEAKTDAAEQNQQRKSGQKDFVGKNKQWQQEM